jgi:hypothetical protein
MDNAFKWIEKNGICTEAAYPCTSGSGSSGTCKTTCAKAVTLAGFTDVPAESAVLSARGRWGPHKGIPAASGDFAKTQSTYCADKLLQALRTSW